MKVWWEKRGSELWLFNDLGGNCHADEYGKAMAEEIERLHAAIADERRRCRVEGRPMRIGKNQLRILVMLGSPTMLMVSSSKENRAMIARGLLRKREDGGAVCITPLGLRVLADEMEAGRVDDALEAMRKDVEARKAKMAAEGPH